MSQQLCRVEYALDAREDLIRLSMLHQDDLELANHILFVISDGIDLLKKHPLVGRQLPNGLRELVISHGSTGYLARYQYDELANLVLVLAIKHQREVDYD